MFSVFSNVVNILGVIPPYMRGTWGFTVLSFFSSGISVILTCGIAVSSSPAVCGFSSFWITHRFWETSLDSLEENRLDKMPTRSATKT